MRVASFLFILRFAAADDNALAEESRLASGLMAASKYEEAIPLYQHLTKAVPGNAGLLLDLGLAQEMAGHLQNAVPQFEAVLRLMPGNVPALTSLAQCRLQLNQPKLAIEPLQKLVALEPLNRDGRGMLAGALLAVERFNDAAKQYRTLTASDEGDAKAWYGLGKSYETLAANGFARLEKMAPESGYVLALIGDSQLSRRQYRSAFFFYTKAQAKTPNLAGLRAALADVYRQSGHNDWAELAAAQEARIGPPDCVKHPVECQVEAGKFLDAVQMPATNSDALFWQIKAYNQLAYEAFDRLGHLPESIEIHALQAAILKEHRQYLEAANEWKAALHLSPDNPQLQRELAEALYQAKDYETLIPMLEAAIKNGESSAEANFLMGATLQQTQQPDKALGYLETALQLDSTLLSAHASIGLALVQLNRASDAIPHLEKAVDADTDGGLHYQLARAYQSAGETGKAKAAMEKYQQIQKQNREQTQELDKEAQITAPEGRTP